VNKYLSKHQPDTSQQGIVLPALMLLVAVAAVLIYFVISSTAPFKDGFLSSFFPKSSSQAAGVVDLSLVPDTISVKQNDTFLVDVVIDAKTSQPTAMELEINYDPAVLQMTALEPGFFFSKTLVPPAISSGKGTVTLAQDIGNYKSGTGSIVTLAFKALQNTSAPAQITINPTTTQIAALNENGNVVGSITNSTVNVSQLAAINKNAEIAVTVPAAAQPIGQEFAVQLKAKTGTESANLFVSKLSFDPSKLLVSRIDTGGSFVTQWVNNNSFDNANGKVTLIGGVPNPGYQASVLTTMATVYFTGKTAGSADINLDGASAIYRNSDNQDILGTQTNGTVTISTVSVSPSPSPVVSPSPAISPSPVVSVAPSASPVASVAISPSPSPVVSPSSAPVACSVSQANWVPATNPINEGKVVGLTVTGTGSCAGKSVTFQVLEDDGILGTDPARNQPPTVKFDANGKANTSWLAEFQADGFNGINNPPEYYFNATVDSTTVKSADPLLLVNQAVAGTFNKGDANRDGVIDLVDLSILLSNWNKTSGFNDELDYNDDTVINTFDFAGLVQLLILGGRI
jgi:hypothetical protein